MSTPDATVGPRLPLLQATTIEEKITQVREQREIVGSLRAGAAQDGDPTLAIQADALQEQYAVREQAGLNVDVYRAAAGAPNELLGWLRASEHPELLRQAGYARTDAGILRDLQPPDSAFRAEIYLPDPRVFGPEVKPQLVFKGTSGLVTLEEPDPANPGRSRLLQRDSTIEDHVNNARQGVGLQSSHYDRAMDLAIELQSGLGRDFEISGHSLGAGMAAAGSAVTGIRATTFNPATLHPATVARFAEANPQVATFDPRQTVTAYAVDGDVLHGGRGALEGMGDLRRQQVGVMAAMAGDISRLPEARQALEGALRETFPHNRRVQQDAIDLVDHLGTLSGREIAAQLPTVVTGNLQPVLAPMMRDAGGALVDRPQSRSLAVVADDSGPLLNVLTAALAGARVGQQAGQVVAEGGRLVEAGVDRLGNAAQATIAFSGHQATVGARHVGRIGDWSVRQGGEVVANVQLVEGHAGVALSTVQCAANRWTNDVTSRALRLVGQLPLGDRVSEELGTMADRGDRNTRILCEERFDAARTGLSDARDAAQGTREAATRYGDAVQARMDTAADNARVAIDRVAAGANHVIDLQGQGVRSLTDSAPTLMAAQGFVVTGLGSAAVNYAPGTPLAIVNAWNTHELVAHAQAAAGAAVQRHSMSDTVIPSLDARTGDMEVEAVRRLAQPVREAAREPAGDAAIAPSAPPASAGTGTPSAPRQGAMLLDHPAHPEHRWYRDAVVGVYAIDASVGRTPDLRSDQLSGALAAAARERGMPGIDHIVLNDDASRTFAVAGNIADPAHLRVSVPTIEGLDTPLAASTQRIEAAAAEQSRQQVQAQELQPERDARGAVAYA